MKNPFPSQLQGMLLAAALLISPVPSSFAGGESSGGGDAIILPGVGDDRVVLADPFVQREGEPGELNPAIVAELKLAGRILVSNGAKGRWTEADFVNDNALSPLTEYRFVSGIPDIADCRRRVRLAPLPPEARLEQVGCTVGALTWIREDIFREMSVRQQAVTLVHERLRALPNSVADEVISNITHGLDIALSLFHAQVRGERPVLTHEQIRLLENLRKGIFQAGLSALPVKEQVEILKQFSVTAQGGGLVSPDAVLDPSAYVGIGASVGRESQIGPGSELIATNGCPKGMCYLAKNSSVQNSILEVSRNPVLSKSSADARFVLVSLGEGARIRDSIVVARYLALDPDSTISNAMYSAGAGWDAGYLRMGQGSTIEESEIRMNGHGDDDSYSSTLFSNDPGINLILRPYSGLINAPKRKKTADGELVGLGLDFGRVARPFWARMPWDGTVTTIEFGDRKVFDFQKSGPCSSWMRTFIFWPGEHKRFDSMEALRGQCLVR